MYQIIITLFILLAIIWRVTYINGLLNDWNSQLNIYIDKLKHNPAVSTQALVYLKKYKLNKWKYYWRIDVWEIKDMINDPFLIQEIHSQIQNKYQR